MPGLDSIREGIAYIRLEPVLRWVVVLAIVTAVFTRPYIQLLPAEAQYLGLSAVQLSFLLAASGVGALTGALLTASLSSWRKRGLLLVGAAMLHGASITLFSFQRSLVGAMIVIALTGLAVLLFLGMANTLMQSRTPDHLRGRAMSVYTMIFIGFMPLGQMLLGSIGTLAGINISFLLGGLMVVLVAVVIALRVPALRNVTTAVERPAA